MAKSQQILKLDVSAEQSFIYLKCKQYDSQSRIYQLIITDRNIPILLKGTEYITAGMRKPDNTYADTVCQWKDNKLYLTMTDNMLSVAGDGILEIRIYEKNTDEIISTMLIHVNIQRSTLPYDKMISSHEFHVLNNLILSVLHAADISKETEALLEKIKNDIAIYETEYTELSMEAKELIAALTTFIIQAETKEAERISNELQRIANENNRISAEQRRETTISHTLQNIITITNNAMEATNQANSASDNANSAILIINQTNTDITNAEAIRIANESQRIDNETIRQTQEANRENSTSDSLSHIYAAITNTNSATDRANEIAADLEEKRDTGYYKGERGEDGNNGVILNLDANCYAFEIEGDSLYLVYSNETVPPDFSIDTDGYLVIDVI